MNAGVGDTSQWPRALAAVPTDPGSSLSTHMSAHNSLLTTVPDLTPSGLVQYQAQMWYADRHTGKTKICITKIKN